MTGTEQPQAATAAEPGQEGPSGGVLIVDFGAQYCQLIARRVRELGVYSRITVPERAMFTFQHMRPAAVILSGGPRSVYEHDAPALDSRILEQGVPVLGICYGLQWLAQHTGGEVTPAQACLKLTANAGATAGSYQIVGTNNCAEELVVHYPGTHDGAANTTFAPGATISIALDDSEVFK